MKWAESKREKPDFFNEKASPEKKTSSDPVFDSRVSSQENHSKLQPGPHWEVEGSGPSDFVQNFFKPA